MPESTARYTTHTLNRQEVAAEVAGDVPSHTRSQPRWAALFAALAAVGQRSEDVIFAVATDTDITTATGEALAEWARIIGIAPLGLTTPELRRVISAWLAAEASTGTREEVIAVWRAVTGGYEVTYRDFFPASFSLQALVTTPARDVYARRIVEVMDAAREAGVGASYVEATAGALRLGTVVSGVPVGEPGYGVGTLARDLRGAVG